MAALSTHRVPVRLGPVVRRVRVPAIPRLAVGQLAAAALSLSISVGALSVVSSISGAGVAASQGSASLNVGRPLSATSAALTSSTGDLTAVRGLYASTLAAAQTVGTLQVANGISGASSATSQAAGSLTVQRVLSGTAIAQSASAGSISATVSPSASTGAQSTSAGALTVIRALSAATSASAVATGALTAGGAAVFTDDFNRANETLGSSPNWTRVDGQASALTIDNNMLASATTAETTYLSPDLGSANHYVEATLRLVGANGPFLLCRATNLSNWLGVRNSASVYQTFKRVNGTLTQLTSASPTPAVGDRIRLQVNGDAGSLMINGVEVAGSPFQLLGDLAGVTRQGVIARTSIRNPWIDDYKAGVL